MFGHYPTSTIVSGLPGVREVLGRGLVYLCGHLHNMHGLAGRLYARHKVRTLRVNIVICSSLSPCLVSALFTANRKAPPVTHNYS